MSEIALKVDEALANGHSINEIQNYLDSNNTEFNVLDFVMRKIQEQPQQVVQEQPQQVVQEQPQQVVQEQPQQVVQEQPQQEPISSDYVQDKIQANQYSAAIPNIDRDTSIANEIDEAQDIVALTNNLKSRYSHLGSNIYASLSGDKEKTQKLRKDVLAIRNSIISNLTEHGFPARYNTETQEFEIKTKDGNIHNVTPSLLDDLWASLGETGGAMIGAAAGATAGAAVGSVVPVVGTAVGAVAGGALTAIAGAMLGSGADYINNSIKLHEKMSLQEGLDKMADAGEFEAVAGIVMGGSASLASKATKATVKGLQKAYNFLNNGNTKAAYEMLRNEVKITDDEAQELVFNWVHLLENPQLRVQTTANKTRPATTEEAAILAIANTRQEATAYLSGGNVFSTLPALSINARAKDFTKTIRELAGSDSAPQDIVKHLKDYNKEVKQYYGTVTNKINSLVPEYRFTPKELAINKYMAKLANSSFNDNSSTLFNQYKEELAELMIMPNMDNLIQTRQLVNKIKNTSTNYRIQKQLTAGVKRIDSIINKALKDNLDTATAKLATKEWTLAKSNYSEMLALESNSTYKALMNPKQNKEKFIAELYKGYESVGSLLNPIMAKLDKPTRKRVELSSIQHATAKNTFGRDTDLQAVHFPQLAADLNELDLKSTQAIEYRDVVNQFASIFKSDHLVASAVSHMSVIHGQSALTTNAVTRAKFAAANEIFNAVARLFPTKMGRRKTIVHLLNRALDQDLTAISVNKLMDAFPEDYKPRIKSLISDLQVAIQQNPEVIKRTGALTIPKHDLSKPDSGYKLNNKPKSDTDIKVEIDESKVASKEDVQIIKSLIGEDASYEDIYQELVDFGYKGIEEKDGIFYFDKPKVFKVK